jgi:hypothetical protein
MYSGKIAVPLGGGGIVLRLILDLENKLVVEIQKGKICCTVLTDIHINHNRSDIIILNKQQKQAYLLDVAVPNSHNITQTYNTKINKYLELSVAMRNLWCLEKISILPLIISGTGIVPQSFFKNFGFR